MSAKVIKITQYHWGHSAVTFDDGRVVIFGRGEVVPKMGEELITPTIPVERLMLDGTEMAEVTEGFMKSLDVILPSVSPEGGQKLSKSEEEPCQ